MKLALEFAGGMELLFANQRELEVDLPGDSTAVNVKTALAYIRDCVLVDTARADMFMKGSTIRPGVLVLINDVDWELTGMDESGTCGDGDGDDGDDGDGDDAVRATQQRQRCHQLTAFVYTSQRRARRRR
jgi:ubiquitin related modifier 1